MFHLVTIEDKVRIAPGQFNNEVQTIEDEIEKKYTSKVVLNAGLFVALYDILGTGDSYVYSGDGGAHLMVRFRMVVFKPFKGEVLEGVIKKSSKEFIQISVGFFHEIYLNPIELPNPSNYNVDEGLWYWEWNENQLFFEDGGRVRFKIDHVEFNPEVSQPAPAPKNVNTENMDSYSLREYRERQVENEKLLKQVKSPLILKVSMRDAGLGMVSWWTNQEEEEEEYEQQPQEGDEQMNAAEGEEYQEETTTGTDNNLGGEDEEEEEIIPPRDRDEEKDIDIENVEEEEEEEEVIEEIETTKSKRSSRSSSKDKKEKEKEKKEKKEKSTKKGKKEKEVVASAEEEEEEEIVPKKKRSARKNEID